MGKKWHHSNDHGTPPPMSYASDRHTHRGHLVTRNPIDGVHHVSKDGHHITSQPSADHAHREIDNLVDER